jgi:hypothetical protein
MLQSTQANANRLVFLFLLQTGKLYTLSNLRTLNAKVKLRERMKSDDFARGSLGNWSWRQADSGVDHEMSMSATVSELRLGGVHMCVNVCVQHERSSFRAATSERLLSISIGPSERSVVDSQVSVLDQQPQPSMPIDSNSLGSRSAQ